MICIACHDAGGAEFLASWAARCHKPYALLLAGPALKIFQRRLGPDFRVLTLEQALDTCDNFITGTSWQSDLEWRVIRAARNKGKKVVTFLDHWAHYRERFIRNGEECLPNSIWTGDTEAHSLASSLFPGIPIELVHNPYFEDVQDELASFAITRDFCGGGLAGLNVLFVCEPLSQHGLQEFGNPLHWGYTEFDSLRYFFSRLDLLGGAVAEVVIRPHPSEIDGKYDAIAIELQGDQGPPVRIGGESSLLKEIADCDVVVGCESMAMVIGLIAGRRVISAIPPVGQPCSLPHKQIESLSALEGFALAEAATSMN